MTSKKRTTPEAPKKFTMKQEFFIKNYVSNGGNATKAALDAGYSPKTAQVSGLENLGKPLISAEIERYKDSVSAEVGLTIEFKYNAIRQGIEACLEGRATGNGAVDARGLTGLLGEANKMAGHYAPERSINANINTEVDNDVVAELIEKYRREF